MFPGGSGWFRMGSGGLRNHSIDPKPAPKPAPKPSNKAPKPPETTRNHPKQPETTQTPRSPNPPETTNPEKPITNQNEY